jgi:hypothetical protein
MGNRDRLPPAADERARAVRRLKEVVAARRHLRDKPSKANATNGKVNAVAALRVADDDRSSSA